MTYWVDLQINEQFSAWVPWVASSVSRARAECLEYYRQAYPWFTYQVFVVRYECPDTVQERLKKGIILGI